MIKTQKSHHKKPPHHKQPTSLRGTKQTQKPITTTHAIATKRHCEGRSKLKNPSQNQRHCEERSKLKNHYQKIASFLAMTTRDGNNDKRWRNGVLITRVYNQK